MIRKKIGSFSIDMIRTLLRGTSFTSPAVSDFEVFICFRHIVVFCQCGLEYSKVGSRSKVGSFIPVKSHWMMNISANFWPDGKVLWMTLGQLLKIFIKFPMFDCSRALKVLLRGQKSCFGPIWVRKGPKKLNMFIGILRTVASTRSKAQAKDSKKLY